MAQRLVEQNADAIERNLRSILANGTNREKIDAMKLLISAGFQSERIDQSEHREQLQHRSREELIALLADKLTRSPSAGLATPDALGKRPPVRARRAESEAPARSAAA